MVEEIQFYFYQALTLASLISATNTRPKKVLTKMSTNPDKQNYQLQPLLQLMESAPADTSGTDLPDPTKVD
jgi:hypothetical protein